ncbi:GAF and ANTAR domain-containing protein [Streptomyces hilarionis]|uniref:GAF and ANTAR domain-containing protein n=1 Tax=Streptomyces hilarionis TaxID=2839954 RepID=UPI00211A5A24|nr:GAF and ANTAR domain-containing protein [Streptomyces hilarionis]MCQ9134971.1 GAF and ANTAR domain-containing protein [Streptomyces hilarionis]
MGGQERSRVAEAVAREMRGAGPREVPQRLCDAVVKLLPVDGVGVALRGEGIPVPLGASGQRAADVMELEVTLGDGPGLEAAATGAPVSAGDLSSSRDACRWPVFAQQAAAAGVRSVYALPLGDGAVCVGTLDLYREVPGELTADELRTARTVADVVTSALVTLLRSERDDAGRWLGPPAADHDEVYQAVGMVMVQSGVPADEALALLRGQAFARDCPVLELAHEVIALRTRLDR